MAQHYLRGISRPGRRGSILARGLDVQRKARKLSDSRTNALSAVQPLTGSSVAGHVLIADADEQSRERLSTELRAAGFHVSVARTGFEAIVKTTWHLPDVILLDESLTGLEATETRRLIATCPATAHIPVIRTSSREKLPRRVLRLIKGRHTDR